jgi:serine/threonine-protein kinase
MTISIAEFWKLAIKSRLLALEDCQRLEAEFAGVKGAADQGNAVTLGEWLIASGVLSRFQVKTFMAGRPGPFVYGDYYVYDRIRSQEGRLANLFRAVHLPTRHPVLLHFLGGAAIKDPQAWEAVVRQVGWACWVGHPNVSDCYQLVDLGKIKLVAIESLVGETLATRLAGAARLPPAEACRFAREAALGLSRLHQLGQVHGQIQPDNLWLDANGSLKVLQTPLAPELLAWPGPIDWSAADPAGKVLTAADYAAPELAQPGRSPDALSDIYALGASLYQMLSGWPPFTGGDVATKLARHAAEPMPSLEPYGVPEPLAQLVAYLLAKDPAQRYQQAHEVANAVSYFVDPATLAAAPQPAPTAAAFDDWLSRQSRVPGAAPGAIPTTTSQAAFAAAQQQQPSGQDLAAQQAAAQAGQNGGWPDAWSAQQPAAEQPAAYDQGYDPTSQYAAPPYPGNGYPDPASQYPANQYPTEQYPSAQFPAVQEPTTEYLNGQYYGADSYAAPYAPAAGAAINYAAPAVGTPDFAAGAAPAEQANSFFQSLQSESTGFDPTAHIPGPAEQLQIPDVVQPFAGPATSPVASGVAAPGQKSFDLGRVLEPGIAVPKVRTAGKKPAARKADSKVLLAMGGFAALVGLIVILIVVKAMRNDKPVDNAYVTQNTTDTKPGPGKTQPPESNPKNRPPDHGATVPAKGPGSETNTGNSGNPATSPPAATTADSSDSNIKTEVVPDDGLSLWASPTAGRPLSLDYVAAGAQVIFSVRPSQIVRRPDGDQILPSFGPWGELAQGALKQATGLELAQIDRVTAVLVDSGDGNLAPTYVIRTPEKLAAEGLLAAWGNPKATTEGSETYYQGASVSYYLPAKEGGKVLCIGPAAQIKDIIQSAGGAPRVSRYLERMIRYTDGDRDLTLLFLPPYLLGDGKSFFSGALAPLRQPFANFFGDEAQAAIFSLHFQGDLFLELRLLASADKDPENLSGQFASRVRTLPAVVENDLDALNLHPYDRKLLRRYPEWMRLLSEYTRNGVEEDQAVLRCYLPGVATHNLLLASELTLAEQGSTGGPAAVATGGPAKAQTIADLLKKKTTLTFPRDTLERSLQLLFDDLGVKYEILGGDLQLEGITKNQSFGLNETDKPAGEILRKIMLLANADGKLIYVIKPKAPGGPEMLFITTRASAAKRGDKIPPELAQPATPPKKKP